MKEQIDELFKKYINKTINDDELFQLQTFFQSEENQEQLKQLLEEYFWSDTSGFQELHEKSEAVESLAWNRIQQSMGLQGSSAVNKSFWFIKFAAAAAILLVLSISFYLIKKPGTGLNSRLNAYNADVQPGTNRATLTSSKGVVYKLSGTQEEIITDKNNIHYKNGTVIGNEEINQKLTLSTPRGGQYRVTLSDGSKVWLNAASSLSYPATFTGKERKVELKGEAYFEVAHNAQQPFIVSTESQEVKVLGTSFNVNAYKDELRTTTTLVNGSVQLSRKGYVEVQRLHPGEQAILGDSDFKVAQVDVSIFSSWKDGQFRFKATPLVEAIRQIERWYDLEVDYTGIPTDIQIHASISRDKKLSTVIHALEKISGLKFDLKGRSVKLMR